VRHDNESRKGSYRNLIERPSNLVLSPLPENSANISFSLSSGAYATICIREIMGASESNLTDEIEL
jgi:tRNA(Glu) U13 pseudouridine synthase TruD